MSPPSEQREPVVELDLQVDFRLLAQEPSYNEGASHDSLEGREDHLGHPPLAVVLISSSIYHTLHG
jgi:hypothetical protein